MSDQGRAEKIVDLAKFMCREDGQDPEAKTAAMIPYPDFAVGRTEARSNERVGAYNIFLPYAAAAVRWMEQRVQ